jgi:hypothetical protein
MTTEVGHISGLLQSEDETETPLTRQLSQLTNQILLIAGAAVGLSIDPQPLRGRLVQGVFTGRDRLRDLAIPTGLPAGRDDDPLARHADAREGERDREAPALDRDASARRRRSTPTRPAR